MFGGKKRNSTLTAENLFQKRDYQSMTDIGLLKEIQSQINKIVENACSYCFVCVWVLLFFFFF